jgi:heptosyltransferase-2
VLLPKNIKAYSLQEFQAINDLPVFDLVISLEEDLECAKLATSIKCKQLTGVYYNSGQIQYTEDSSSWYDMSRISRLGRGKANELKKENRRTYQDHIFQMVGKTFHGEKYMLSQPGGTTEEGLIGIETRTGDRWPNKQWAGYDELIRILQSERKNVRVFQQREQLQDYLDDINSCSYIISGDTLAMHLAMAYGKKCTAIFNCTSPDEIYDYGLLSKVVSPLLLENFYSTSLDERVISSVSVEEVYQTIRY